MTELSDELLVAYVDGQLARKQTRAVEKVLEQDDVIARRVDALKDAHSRLEAAFEAILAGEEADAAARPMPQAPGLFIAWDTLAKGGLAAAGIAIALILVVAGYGWPLVMPEFARHPSAAADPDYVGSIQRTWQEEAVRAQALLSRASLEVGLESQGNRDLVGFQLAQAIGPSLNAPDLTPQGFRFMRGQLLHFGAEPLGQLLYLGTSGAPLALYAKKGEGTLTPLFKQYGDIGSVAWSQGGIAYLLAGEGDQEFLLRLAETIIKEEPKAAVRSPAYSPLPPPPRPKPKPKP
jgi:anti-sigma factor RsiW